jgi:hypothetical protein
MASTIELLLLAQMSGPGSPVLAQAASATIPSGNATAATLVTQAWTALPGTPAVGTVYTVETEFGGAWEGNSLALAACIAGTYYQFTPDIGSGAFSAGAALAGWLRLTVRVTAASACKISMAGAIVATTTGLAPGSGSVAIATTPSTEPFAGADTIGIGVLFGASNSSQTIICYGSTFTIAAA